MIAARETESELATLLGRLRRIILLLPMTACFLGGSAQVLDGGDQEAAVEAAAEAAPEAAPPDAAVCSPDAPDAGDLPCDVAAVLESKCQPCHHSPPANGAPFPLLTYEDLVSPFGTDMLRWQRVAQVVEPDASLHMPPVAQPQPTPADLDTLRAWFAACAPPTAEGSGCDVGENASDASPD